MSSINNMNQDSGAKATYKRMRVTPRKLSQFSSLRGMKVPQALAQLSFCRKRIANEVSKCLNSAVANIAPHVNINDLVVAEVLIGKGGVMKRMMPRAKSRSASIRKFFSHLTIRVKEKV